jgi:uncharacterized protein
LCNRLWSSPLRPRRTSKDIFRVSPWRGGSALARPALIAAISLFASLAFAALTFPPLTGRVVDGANILSPAARARVEAKEKELEDKSGIQLVVATVPSLQGADIETFGYQLGRFWKLGEAKKNNGVLFLVAPNERKVRIDVGYGLEGTLTDALSKVIISTAVAPQFKKGDFDSGVERGVDAIINVLTTDSGEWQKRAKLRSEGQESLSDQVLFFVIFALVLFSIVTMLRSARGGGRYRRGRGPVVFFPPGNDSWGGGGSSSGGGSFGGGDSGGFSGGGGSFGGGGASGDW